MEENKKEEKVENKAEEKESMLGLIIIVIAIILIGVGAGLFIVMPKNSSKESTEPASNTGVENTENNNIENNNNEFNTEDDEPIGQVDYTITKEEVESFLNDLVPDFVHENIISEKTDDNQRIFYHCLQYLVFNNKYTKEGETFIFNISDFESVARKYFMRENFEPIDNLEGTQTTIDTESQTVRMIINFGLSDPGPEFTKEKSLTDFKFENGIAEATYNVILKYTEPVSTMDGRQITEDINTYQVELIKVNDELRISKVTVVNN